MKKLTSFIFVIGFIAFVFLYVIGNVVSTTSIDVNFNKARQFNSLLKTEPPIDFVPVKLKIKALGDSLTVGIGSTGIDGGYLNYVKNHLNEAKGVKSIEITNLAKTGIRSNGLLQMLEDKNIESQIQDANIIFITVGGNDLMKVIKDHIVKLELTLFEQELVNFKNRLRDILKKLEEYNEHASVLLIGFYNPFDEWIGQINEVQIIMDNWTKAGEEVVTEFPNAYYVNIADVFAAYGQEALSGDYFHPNDFGYELIGKETMDVLLENLEAILLAGKVTLHDEKN